MSRKERESIPVVEGLQELLNVLTLEVLLKSTPATKSAFIYCSIISRLRALLDQRDNVATIYKNNNKNNGCDKETRKLDSVKMEDDVVINLNECKELGEPSKLTTDSDSGVDELATSLVLSPNNHATCLPFCPSFSDLVKMDKEVKVKCDDNVLDLRPNILDNSPGSVVQFKLYDDSLSHFFDALASPIVHFEKVLRVHIRATSSRLTNAIEVMEKEETSEIHLLLPLSTVNEKDESEACVSSELSSNLDDEGRRCRVCRSFPQWSSVVCEDELVSRVLLEHSTKFNEEKKRRNDETSYVLDLSKLGEAGETPDSDELWIAIDDDDDHHHQERHNILSSNESLDFNSHYRLHDVETEKQEINDFSFDERSKEKLDESELANSDLICLSDSDLSTLANFVRMDVDAKEESEHSSCSLSSHLARMESKLDKLERLVTKMAETTDKHLSVSSESTIKALLEEQRKVQDALRATRLCQEDIRNLLALREPRSHLTLEEETEVHDNHGSKTLSNQSVNQATDRIEDDTKSAPSSTASKLRREDQKWRLNISSSLNDGINLDVAPFSNLENVDNVNLARSKLNLVDNERFDLTINASPGNLRLNLVSPNPLSNEVDIKTDNVEKVDKEVETFNQTMLDKAVNTINHELSSIKSTLVQTEAPESPQVERPTMIEKATMVETATVVETATMVKTATVVETTPSPCLSPPPDLLMELVLLDSHLEPPMLKRKSKTTKSRLPNKPKLPSRLPKSSKLTSSKRVSGPSQYPSTRPPRHVTPTSYSVVKETDFKDSDSGIITIPSTPSKTESIVDVSLIKEEDLGHDNQEANVVSGLSNNDEVVSRSETTKTLTTINDLDDVLMAFVLEEERRQVSSLSSSLMSSSSTRKPLLSRRQRRPKALLRSSNKMDLDEDVRLAWIRAIENDTLNNLALNKKDNKVSSVSRMMRDQGECLRVGCFVVAKSWELDLHLLRRVFDKYSESNVFSINSLQRVNTLSQAVEKVSESVHDLVLFHFGAHDLIVDNSKDDEEEGREQNEEEKVTNSLNSMASVLSKYCYKAATKNRGVTFIVSMPCLHRENARVMENHRSLTSSTKANLSSLGNVYVMCNDEFGYASHFSDADKYVVNYSGLKKLVRMWTRLLGALKDVNNFEKCNKKQDHVDPDPDDDDAVDLSSNDSWN